MKYITIICAVAVAACASGGNGTSGAWDAAVQRSYQGLNSAADVSSVTVPILKSKGFENKWGKPKSEVGAAGDYRLNYSDPSTPFNQLVVFGSPRPWPQLSSPPKMSSDEMVNGELGMVMRSQSWRTVVVAGKTVRFFKESSSGGADGAYYSTEGFAMTGPDGRTGYYRLVVEAGDDESVVRQRFASVGF